MLLKKQVDDPQSLFYLSYCKYCGRPFIKTHNRQVYCGEECKSWSRKEQKAIYQRKRRRLINKGILISNETQRLGTSHLSQNRHIDEVKEFLAVHTELKRIMRIRI